MLWLVLNTREKKIGPLTAIDYSSYVCVCFFFSLLLNTLGMLRLITVKRLYGQTKENSIKTNRFDVNLFHYLREPKKNLTIAFKIGIYFLFLSLIRLKFI